MFYSQFQIVWNCLPLTIPIWILAENLQLNNYCNKYFSKCVFEFVQISVAQINKMRNIKNELEENGIAIIRNFASEAECDALRNGIVDVVKRWISDFIPKKCKILEFRVFSASYFSSKITRAARIRNVYALRWRMYSQKYSCTCLWWIFFPMAKF